MGGLFLSGCKDRWNLFAISPVWWVRIEERTKNIEHNDKHFIDLPGTGNWCTLPGVGLLAGTVVVAAVVAQLARRCLIGDDDVDGLWRWSVNKYTDGGVKNVLLATLGCLGIALGGVVTLIAEVALLPLLILSLAVVALGLGLRAAWALAPYLALAFLAAGLAAVIGVALIASPVLIGVAVGSGVVSLGLMVGSLMIPNVIQ